METALLCLLQTKQRLKATHPKLHLNLEASALSTTTSTLELTALRTDIRSGLAAGSSGNTEVLHSSTGSTATLKKDGVSTSGAAESELIEGDALTTSLENTSTSSFSEMKSAHLHGRNFNHADIVSNSTNNHSDLVLLTLHVSGKSIQAHGRTVDSAHVETSQNDSGELSSSTASDEAVKLTNEQNEIENTYLDQKSKINIITLRSFTGLVPTVTTSSN